MPALQPAVRAEGQFAPLYHAKFVLPSSRVNTLNSDPMTLLAAKPGVGYLPVMGYAAKKNGAYTQESATSLQFRRVSDSVVIGGMNIIMLTTSGPFARFFTQSAGAGGGVRTDIQLTEDDGIELFVAGGDTSGSGGELTVVLYYMAVQIDEE